MVLIKAKPKIIKMIIRMVKFQNITIKMIIMNAKINRNLTFMTQGKMMSTITTNNTKSIRKRVIKTHHNLIKTINP